MARTQTDGNAWQTLYWARIRCRSSGRSGPSTSSPRCASCSRPTARASASSPASRSPTFASVVEPLEELHHRISRTWSPVSHLNAVLNSDALRAGYNACLPLLSAYQTDLAQSEPLYRAYRTIADERGRGARRRCSAASSSTRCATSASPASG